MTPSSVNHPKKNYGSIITNVRAVSLQTNRFQQLLFVRLPLEKIHLGMMWLSVRERKPAFPVKKHFTG